MKVIHRECGGQIGTCTAEPHERRRAKDFTRMDGSQPQSWEKLEEECPTCAAVIRSFKDMQLTAGTNDRR